MAEPMDVDDSSSLSSLSDSEDRLATPRPATNASKSASTPTATNGDNFRRRSSRVVKKPTPYVEPPSSTRRAKRKRPTGEDDGDDDDDDDDESNADASSETVQGDGSDREQAEDNEDEGTEDESEEESDEEEESEGEPDEEELKERRRKSKKGGTGRGGGAKRARGGRPATAAPRKPAAKKVKTDEPAKPKAQKKRAAPRAKGKEKAANGDAPPRTANDIYDAVFESGDDKDEIANSWVAKYLENNSKAMAEMVNFILKCCGCDNEVTNFDIEDQDSAATTLSQVQEAFQQQQTADYPLTSKKPAFRKFRPNLNAFIEALMQVLSDKDLLVSDPGLMESMQVWITAMSSSTLRQFRHTSTVIALDMVSHLSEIASEIRKSNGTINRQVDGESKKPNKNVGRIKDLNDKLAQGEERREAVENIIKDIFDTVFVHRYRDIDAKIRSECMHELGNWILTLPDVFFDGAYLRYLGWVLSDTTPATRLEVIKALTKLFRRKNSVSGLRHFTERFRPRLVEMGTRDADSSVRAATVELLDVVREVGYLEPNDIHTIGRLLFDSEQKVRRAVVPFFVENINDLYDEKLEELGGEDAVKEAIGDDEDEDYEGPTLSWIKMKCLVEVLASYDQEEAEEDGGDENQMSLAERNSAIVTKVGEIVSRFSLAGAVLWDHLDEVRDWEGLGRYLLYDHSANRIESESEAEEDVETKVKRAVALDAKEDVILLQVVHASVTGSIWKGPEPPHKKKAGQQTRTVKEIEKHKENVSRSLMQFIPQLLRKFGPVPDAAASVLRLEQLMKLDIFQELRQSEAYSGLLDEINRQFLTHSDEGVLKEASAALRHAKTFEDLAEITDSKISQLKDETVTALITAIRGKDLSKAKFSETAMTEIVNTVRRLEYLSGITDCVEMMETAPTAVSKKQREVVPINILLDLLMRSSSGDDLDEELILRTINVLVFYFMWKVRTVNHADEGDINDIDIDEILNRRSTAIQRLTAMLEQRTAVSAVEIAAAGSILDLTTMFVSATNPRLSSLVTMIDPAVQEHLKAVLDAVEKSYAKATGRTLEPDENAEPEDEDEENEDEELDESSKLMLEQRLCEYAAKIIVAAIARVLDAKAWRKRMNRNQTRLGPNYKEVVNHLDRGLAGRSTRKQTTAAAKKKVAEKKAMEVEDDEIDEHEEEEEEEEEEAPEEEPHHQDVEEDEPAKNDESDRESEPDPEAPNIDDDGDELMGDA